MNLFGLNPRVAPIDIEISSSQRNSCHGIEDPQHMRVLISACSCASVAACAVHPTGPAAAAALASKVNLGLEPSDRREIRKLPNVRFENTYALVRRPASLPLHTETVNLLYATCCLGMHRTRHLTRAARNSAPASQSRFPAIVGRIGR